MEKFIASHKTFKVCKNGHEINQQWNFCGQCGEHLVTVIVDKCPSCHEVALWNCSHCPKCGEKYPVKED